ncbi:MAG: glycosyltransferase family 2 protein [Planctomycetaceae bacterium]
MTSTPAGGRLPDAGDLSAVVITRNASRRLADVLAAVEFCAERLVLDSGSTDDTVAIARAAGARVEFQPFLGYGPQKRRAVDLAAHDWILSIDADEVLDDEARRAARDAPRDDPAACYAFRRRTFVGRREIKHGAWSDDRVVRLFNRRTAAFKPLQVHEEVEAARPPVLLPGTILHYSYESLGDVLARPLRYAPLKAAVMRGKGQAAGLLTMPFRGLAAFTRSYLIRGGWRDGAAGFVIALARVIESTLPRAMLLEGEPAGESSAAQPADLDRSAASIRSMSAGSAAESMSRSPDAG